MAQKAAKQQASRNSAILKRTHLISLGVNTFFVVLRFVIFGSSLARATWLPYLLLSSPAFAIEIWLERIGRPTTSNSELKRSGEDLEAKGLTEYMWDVLYWTWGCTVTAGIFGNKAWWLWVVVPLYSVWLLWTTFAGMRQGMAAMAGESNATGKENGAASNRQKKIEKRGGQKVQYR
ncbi:MAG: hypothetical protein LQ351_002849 [Letrouitia transgressa]|nr:MAG: hypothetical protein LQ351_002849 [Letrouitia transgressa]